MMPSGVIFGCEGTRLSADEARFFADVSPWGFIVFARNITNPDQLAGLVEELRASVGWRAPVLIDQEGGRIARLRPPHWRAYPPGRNYGDFYAANPAHGMEAARLGARLIADELHAVGIDVDCLPVLDVPVPNAHDVIGDRAYGLTPAPVATLGRAAAHGLMDGGVLPVIKHIPGHGRAGVDSHLSLPIVETPLDKLRSQDFAPFRMLADLPLAMTAHVVYTAIDPAEPATTSAKVIEEVIRGEIGFDGLLMSDDLSMQALAGDLASRTRASFAAGCDVVLHCNGKMDEMIAVASETSALDGVAAQRAQAALAAIIEPAEFDGEAEYQRLQELMGEFFGNTSMGIS
ncbi:MAG: beta-N-acetylhexosaminidase [Rhizobiales bacterium]|nr:beta-N-acetylhexosaminidase [Hyphomicrobiales bacterium]